MHNALTCLIYDDRYQVPTLAFYLGTDVEQARDLAVADLRINPHHDAIEVRHGNEVVFVVRRSDL